MLYNYQVQSDCNKCETRYSLKSQVYLCEDPQDRFRNFGGIGPLNLVKSKMNYSVFPKVQRHITTKYDSYAQRHVIVSEDEYNGVIAYVHGRGLIAVKNWLSGNSDRFPISTRSVQPVCIDYAPYMARLDEDSPSQGIYQTTAQSEEQK